MKSFQKGDAENDQPARSISLPVDQLSIELAYFQGWTHSEIAEGCQIPLGTVKARMRLGLIRLKRIPGEMGLGLEE